MLSVQMCKICVKLTQGSQPRRRAPCEWWRARSEFVTVSGEQQFDADPAEFGARRPRHVRFDRRVDACVPQLHE